MLNKYRNHTPDITLSDDVINCLEKLYLQDIPMGIITDGRTITQSNKIKSLGLLKYINKSNIVISEEIGYDKHHKNGFELIMSNNSNCNNFYYIGDNPSKDFYWPNKLGWTTICVIDNGENIHPQDVNIESQYLPQYLIHNFLEIIPLIL